MTENGQRRDMHPAEQMPDSAQWRRKAKHRHKSVICWLFAPPRSANAETGRPCACHLDALAEDRITTEHCQALALETTPRVRCRCLKPPVSRDGAETGSTDHSSSGDRK